METKLLTESDIDRNEFYARDGVLTARDVSTISKGCLAKWKWKYDNEEEKQSDKMTLGAAAHSIMLSPDKFRAKYYRMPEKSDYESSQLLSSVKDLQGWLKERGVAGRSSTDANELIAKVKETCALTGESIPFLWHEIETQAAEIGRNYSMIRGNDYDAVTAMREVISSNENYQYMFNNGEGPFFVYADLAGVPCKCKFEKIVDGSIWDYMTTSDASPEFFVRNQTRTGVYLRLAFMWQMFKKGFGEDPENFFILAQEKEAPYIPEHYRVTDEALKIGTHQLKALLTRVKLSQDSNKWPTYSGGKVLDFKPSEWEIKQFESLFDKEGKK